MEKSKMNSARLVALCVAAVGVLTLVDIGVRVHQQRSNAFTKQFAAVTLNTNSASGITIIDRTDNKPLWAKWISEQGGTVSFFIEGRLVLNVTYVKEGRAETEVFFYDKDGKLISHWQARESGQFFGRTVFGESGSKSEAWLGERWYPIEVRTNEGKGQEGVALAGKWRRLVFTNGVPSVEN